MSLEQLRRSVDRLDEEIVALLNKRAGCALRIGREKLKHGLPVTDPAREARILKRLANLNKGPLPDKALKAVYRAIIVACRRMQERKKQGTSPAR